MAVPARMPGKPAIHCRAAGTDAEELLDGLAVEVAGVHRAKHVEDFLKPLKPCGLRMLQLRGC